MISIYNFKATGMNIGNIVSKLSTMEMDYTDATGRVQHLQILSDNASSENIFTIVNDGTFNCDIVKEDGVWMELFHGATTKSKEYGTLIDGFFVFSDTSTQSQAETVSLAIML